MDEELGLFARLEKEKPIPFVWKTIEELKVDFEKHKPTHTPYWQNPIVVYQSKLRQVAEAKGITVDELCKQLDPPPTGRSNYTKPKKKRK